MVTALHAQNVPGTWIECKNHIHTEFSTRRSNSSITVLPRVLEKIPVMLFVGDQDMICNYVGVESMIQALHWNGETGLGVSGYLLPRTDDHEFYIVFRYSRKFKLNHGP